jgi:hypothetical protein
MLLVHLVFAQDSTKIHAVTIGTNIEYASDSAICYELPEDKTSFTIVAIFNIWAIKTKNGYEIKLFADDYMKRFVKLETEWLLIMLKSQAI